MTNFLVDGHAADRSACILSILEEGKKAGFRFTGQEQIDLFQDLDVQYYLGGKILYFEDVVGEVHLQVRWQLYSRPLRRVIFDRDMESTAGNTQDAVRDLAARLFAEPSFQRKLQQRQTLPSLRHAVATVFASDGHGSGFFISDKGLMLTNAHVVGRQRRVKVRLLDGHEYTADVLRKDKKRDVALLQVKGHPTTIASLSSETPQVGDTLFAIGSPIDEDYDGTVTQGVLSAYRQMNRQEYLQCDVGIWPGSSGGPLVDINGQVVGISVECEEINEVPIGINFFIPIQEALRAVSAEVS